MVNRINRIERLLADPGETRLDWVLEDLARWIAYFQHERLIHLLVTGLFALLFMLAFILFMLAPSLGLSILLGLLMCLLIPYIRHYYLLENGVQKLYGLFDRVQEIQRQQPGRDDQR